MAMAPPLVEMKNAKFQMQNDAGYFSEKQAGGVIEFLQFQLAFSDTSATFKPALNVQTESVC